MAKPSSKKFHWPTLLFEALLLQIALLPVLSRAAIAAAPSVTADAGSNGAGPTLIAEAIDLTAPHGSELYLEVELNGMPRGLARFGWRDGELWASAMNLRQLGFVLPAGVTDPLRLNSLPGLQVSFDARRQRITLMAPLSLLNLGSTVLGMPDVVTQPASASPGLLLNYDLYGMQAPRGTSSLNAFTELRAFSSAGVFSSTALTQTTRSESGGWQNRTARLDTSWSMSFPKKLLTLRVGDTLTGALPWTRATRIGGVQLSTNFALQPYRITAPLPAFLGSATLPSSVDLYVNGLRQYSGNVPAGPFQLNTIPNISGSGNAQVVLTDALGRATTLNFPLYQTRQLLQKGLSVWSVDLGAVRNNYGLRSFDYGSDVAASGTWRYGVNNSFTLEAHSEAIRKLVNAGVGGAWLLGQAGVLSGSAAQSSHGAQHGSQFNLGYSWNNQRFHVGADASGTQGDYLDVASFYGSAPARGTGSAVIGFNMRDFGSIGLSYLYQRYPGQSATRYASVYWSRSIGRSTSLSLNVNQNLNDRRQHSIFFGITMALSGKTTVSAGMQRDGERDIFSADASRSIPSEGGVGWRTGLRQGGGQGGGVAQVDYLGRYGRVSAGVSALGDSRYAYAGAGGGLVLMGGQPFVTRRIDDAFAVVSTDGIAGVPIKLENRPIGTTDKHGMLLVTPLNAYQNNQLAIDPMQLPPDVRIAHTKTLATPTDRAGTLVRFGITPIRAASILLVDIADKPLSLGSLVRVNNQAGEPALVGFDGAVYLDTLDTHNVLDVQTPAGVCTASFGYQKSADGIAQVGPLRCIAAARP